MPRKSIHVTVTDQFCGCGGSSKGATQVNGVELRMALNHWKLAIETHNSNFPDADHDCTDISACDPRRYPSTNILITSPECTNHSLANGKKKGLHQRDLFTPAAPDPAAERSRATMWDVPRFAEFHGYEYVIVENVPDATRWAMFPAWLHAMKLLGYSHRVLSLNSMFFWPCPQSRDRMYVVFWKDGNAAPDLEFTPRAWCAGCATNVNAVQTWKMNRRTGTAHRVGKYDGNGKQNQYFYSCPSCRQRVEPYFFCALNALDFSIPAVKIGEREENGLPPLKPRTLARTQYGLEKFGRRHLVVTTRYTTGMDFRVRDATEDVMPTQPGAVSHALVSPVLVETMFTHSPNDRVSGGDAPLPAQTTRLTKGLAYLVTAGSRETGPSSAADSVPTLTGSDRLAVTIPPGAIVSNMENNQARGLDGALHGITTGGKLGLALPPSFISTLRGTGADQLPSTPAGLDEALGGITAGGVHHAPVVGGAALVTLRDFRRIEQLVNPLDGTLSTQIASGQQEALVTPGRFLTSYYGQDQASPLDAAVPALTTLDRHALVESDEDLRLEDCYFRMLQPVEIQAGMAFEPDYVVLGNKRDKVKQLGNAVTPPVMEWIVGRCVEALERGRGPKRRVA